MSEEEIISRVNALLQTTFHFEGYTEGGAYFQKYVSFKEDKPYYSEAIERNIRTI